MREKDFILKVSSRVTRNDDRIKFNFINNDFRSYDFFLFFFIVKIVRIILLK